MAVTHINIFWAGSWMDVPSLTVDRKTIIAIGRWPRIASVYGEEWLDTELGDPGSCIAALREHRSEGFRADVLAFSQKPTDTTPKYAYPVEYESVAVIRLGAFDTWWMSLPQETRKNARRAERRGVAISIREVDDEIVRGIVAINDEVPIRQGKRFTHFGESFDRVKTDFLSFADRSELLCAHAGDELIGLIKIVYCGRIGAIMKLQSKVSHYDKRPGNALIAAAVRRCAEKGMTCITYGNYRYGNQERTTLMEFKARHGFEEARVPRYYVPLTAVGRACMTIGLHRGLVGVLPPSLVQQGRELREKWYKRSGVMRVPPPPAAAAAAPQDAER